MMVVPDGKDWTHNVPAVEFPYIKNVDSLYNVTNKVENAHFAGEGHDYKFSKRQPVYKFFAKNLGMDISRITNAINEIDEGFITVQPFIKLNVFTNNHARSAYAVEEMRM